MAADLIDIIIRILLYMYTHTHTHTHCTYIICIYSVIRRGGGAGNSCSDGLNLHTYTAASMCVCV
jgi:hypothetical protein